MDRIEQLIPEIRKLYLHGRKSHDWDHIQRVYQLCLTLAEGETVDLAVLRLAALLHDIARVDEDMQNGNVCHAEMGAVKAKQFLEDHSIDKQLISGVVHCIETHRYKNAYMPETTEARILYDADKLDAIGAIGLGRAFVYAGEIGARVHYHEVDIEKTEPYTIEDTAYREFLVKLRHIKDRMLTEKGRQMALDRHHFMERFFDRLNREVNGEL
jgi:uncharacterized protein